MFDQQPIQPRKIAIIGSGISGLAAALELADNHSVTIFEAADRLGGHARTVIAGRNGDQPVDTGFIVFNHATYPNLTRMFDELKVPTRKSNMSFGASIDNGRVEYSVSSFAGLTAQKRNLIRPEYWRMIRDILRFGKHAEAAATDDDKTIGDVIKELGLSESFHHDYLMPMCGAIWSTPVDEVAHFPARSLVRFFRNHALLAGGPRHQWWTVDGGSIEYVRRVAAHLGARGCRILTSSPVSSVKRHGSGVIVHAKGQPAQDFDEVILACHSDQALRLLGDGATHEERAALSAIRYQNNTAVLHCDSNQMPMRRACWSSWSYRSQKGAIGVTYWMNRLQGIDDSDPLFVTLNPTREINQAKIYDQVDFAHPVFDRAALRAQSELRGLQGRNHTWFAGAYHGNGFHEDGYVSALNVARAIDEKSTTPRRRITQQGKELV